MQSDTVLDSVTAVVRVLSTGPCTGGHRWDTKQTAVWRRAEAGARLEAVSLGHTSLPLHPW